MSVRGAVAAMSATAARVVLGALWMSEGVFKLRAGFGRADIDLVVQGAAANPRVPAWFAWFARSVMGPADGALGLGIPLLELALGIALVLGIAVLPAALASTGTLALYWSSDQLVVQYPVMAVLGAVVLLAGHRPAVLGFPRAVSALRGERGRRGRRDRRGRAAASPREGASSVH